VNIIFRHWLAKCKKRIDRRLDKTRDTITFQPCLTASNIHYAISNKTQAIACGGIGLFQALARRLGLIRTIDNRLHLFKFHMPYHESDHVLNIAYNALCGGTCLQDIELRRNDEAFLDALGTRRIPDPTTAADFCRRFTKESIETLIDAINETRLRVWAEQPDSFLDCAFLDADGTLTETSGACKQGMDISYKGVWGYHPLVVSLANTGEVLSLVNRSGNRPSHENAAREIDRSLCLCLRAGFRKVLLRGDTDFSQTEHLDGWNAMSRVRFIFGYNALDNLEEIAANLPESAWQRLERPARYAVRTQPRQHPVNVKDRIVRERGFETLRLKSEEVAEFEYRPVKCSQTYRMVVVRKNISKEKGEQALLDDIRYFFYITNEREWSASEVVFSANDRCNQENLIAPVEGWCTRVAFAAGDAGEQLGLHGDGGVGLEPEGVVGLVSIGGTGPLAGAAPGAETVGTASGVPNVPERVRAVAVPDSQDGAKGGVSALGLESPPADLLPTRQQTPLLIAGRNDVGIRMSRSALTPRAIEQNGEG
jgi:hypothetical protein